MAYTKKFTRPYETYKDRPDKTTPVTADIKNMESNTFESIEDYLADGVPASDLQTDDNHQTVTKAEKEKWNAGGGGGAVSSVNGQTGAVVLSASDVGALPDSTPIPPAVTENTVAGWGFTKNTGTYSKPASGIPENDLSQEVQAKLNSGGSSVAVIDNLTSDSSTDALSARQGKVLDDKIDERSQGFTYDETESKLTFSGAIGGNGFHVYSNEEHVVGVWKVDGVEKKVYEKIIYIPSLPNAKQGTYPIDIEHIDSVKNYSAFMLWNNDGNGITGLPYINAADNRVDTYVTGVNNNEIKIVTTLDRRNISAQVIIQYTKTTD